jgi:hypothetical protein
MLKLKNSGLKRRAVAFGLVLVGLLGLGAPSAWSKDRDKSETISATAMGTETQLGRQFSITLNIYEYSTPADKQILIDAFQNGKNEGLYNALTKMKSVGHIAVTGTLGFDVSYIEMTPTPNGRRIRFVTNRLLRFGEVYWDRRSAEYNLTAGELELINGEKDKGSGVFYPAAQLEMNKQGGLQINTLGFPWKLTNIIDWQGTPGEN